MIEVFFDSCFRGSVVTSSATRLQRVRLGPSDDGLQFDAAMPPNASVLIDERKAIISTMRRHVKNVKVCVRRTAGPSGSQLEHDTRGIFTFNTAFGQSACI